MRTMQLMKVIAIAKAEEKAINDAIIDERQESNLLPYQTQETTEPKPKVMPTYPQDNSTVKQEINSAVSQPVLPISTTIIYSNATSPGHKSPA